MSVVTRFAAIILLFGTTVSFASPALEPEFDRDSAIAYALENNPDLRAAKLAVAQARAEHARSGLRPPPTIDSAVASGAAFGESGSLDYSLGVSQSLALAGQLDKERAVAVFAILSAEIEILAQQQAIVISICELALELQIVRRRMAYQEEAIAAAEARSRAAAAAVDRGELATLEANAAILETELERNVLEQLRFEEEKLLHRLAPLLGRISSSHLVFRSDSLNTERQVLPDYDESIELRHPEHLAATLNARRAEAQIELEDARRWEPLTARIFIENERRPGLASTSETERMVGASLSVPLPLRRKRDLAIASLRLDQDRARLEAEAARFHIENDIRHARHEAMRLHERSQTFRKNVVELAESQLDAQRQAFADGRIGQLQLMESEAKTLQLQQTLLDLEDDYERAALELTIARRDLPGIPQSFAPN